MIDLTGYKLTFDEEFNSRSISKTGETTTWADIRSEWKYDAHSDIGFGKSSFVDASSGYDPFKIAGGALTITAVPDATPYGYKGSWESGLIHTKESFSQTYGYFEMRADLSDAVGSWDAFWMLPVDGKKTAAGWQELDIVEHYGAWNKGVYSHIHTTDKSIASQDLQVYSDNTDTTKGYHTFGLEWNAKTLNFYVDGILKGTRATPNDMHSEMYLLANLATQSTAKAPMSMSIDYIRAYSKDPNAVAVALDTVSAPDGKDPGLYGATSKVVAAETPVPTDLETLPVQAPPVPVNPTPAAPQPTTSPAVTPVPSPAAVAPPAASPSVTNPGLVLMGTDGADRLTGKAGDDVIHGGAGRDEIIGGAGADKLYGGDGDDVIRADADDTVIDGGAGRDILYVQGTKGLTLDLGKASIEEVIGGVGDDLLDGSRSTANLKLQGGEGDDTLIGGSGRDEIFGGAGADKLYGGDGDDVIRADADDTVIDGGAGRDILYVQGTKGLTLDLAKASIEEVVGGVGDDRLDGSRSTANLKLQGGEGDDTLIGGSGRDEIFGGADADKLYGGDGDDVIRADADDTVIDGGGGRDILYVQGTKGLTLDLAKASIEEVVGGAGDDRLDGSRSTANLKLQGGEGDDTLIGGSGRDEIRGGAGNDTLYGGLGSDILSGGAGDDLFVFNAPKAGNVANITDFEKGQDKLVVDLSAFGWSHAAGALPADAFFASETGRAADDHHRILYNAKTGDISYDADGSGAGKAIVFAHVDAKIQLAASDFQLMV